MGRILPVLFADSPYDGSALNNLYAGAKRSMGPIVGLNDQQHHHLQNQLAQIEALAEQLTGDPEGLLTLLRDLEQLHRRIQDGPFRSSLPADRNHLFTLLQGMEKSGGWPYIPRLQLRTFMDLLQHDQEGTDQVGTDPEGTDPAESPAPADPGSATDQALAPAVAAVAADDPQRNPLQPDHPLAA